MKLFIFEGGFFLPEAFHVRCMTRGHKVMGSVIADQCAFMRVELTMAISVQLCVSLLRFPLKGN